MTTATPEKESSAIATKALFVMVFLSGFAGLVYQVLWMRQLGLLFGNTSHAAAATLSVFFGGLAAGSWFWGKRCTSITNALRTYAWLEVGIALSAILYFFILRIFQNVYPGIYQSIQSPTALLLVKGLLACLLVFPPAFFMGGTIPVVGQYLIRNRERFGKTTAALYGVNTIGAALGAYVTAFYLVANFGFYATCAGAMAITGSIALVSFLLAARSPAPEEPPATETEPVPEVKSTSKKSAAKKNKKGKEGKEPAKPSSPKNHWIVYALAFVSGFSTLALEVLWTRLFAQVHENSVYSFASVLVIVLVCLALGALLASWLTRFKQMPEQILMILTMLSGIGICVSPFIFMKVTDNFQMMTPQVSFNTFVLRVFGVGFATIGPPCLLLGTVFPFLMKSEQRFAKNPGQSIGYLTAVNTVGAILGSLFCGFFMLHAWGMWTTLQLVAVVYFVIALVLPSQKDGLAMAAKVLAIVFLGLAFTKLSPIGLPITGVDPRRGPEKILETWETSDCTVAVIETPYGGLAIKVNSNYSLGSTGAGPHQIFQSRVPLFIYPEAKEIFYLGMGTGITAGASLDRALFPNVEKLVVCELVPEVIDAAKTYIGGGNGGEDFTNGLFTDRRATVIAEDGRHYLMATDETFDIINAELFLPYRSGAGSLYSLDHYKAAKKRLKPGGIFVQWIPHFQITEYEFGVITHTMLEAFDQVTFWRNSLQPGGEIMALVGHIDDGVLPACDLDAREDKLLSVAGRGYKEMQDLLLPFDEKTCLFLYAGNVTAAKDLFDEYPLNTDDKPVIEYSTPKSLRLASGDVPPQFSGPALADLIETLLDRTPPDQDPILKNRSPENRRLPLAGAAFHRAWIARMLAEIPPMKEAWEKEWKTEWRMKWRDDWRGKWEEEWKIFLQHWLNVTEELNKE